MPRSLKISGTAEPQLAHYTKSPANNAVGLLAELYADATNAYE